MLFVISGTSVVWMLDLLDWFSSILMFLDSSLCFFFETGSHVTQTPRIHCLPEIDLEVQILLPLPPSARISGVCVSMSNLVFIAM